MKTNPIADIVREKRRSAGLTQAALAAKAAKIILAASALVIVLFGLNGYKPSLDGFWPLYPCKSPSKVPSFT